MLTKKKKKEDKTKRVKPLRVIYFSITVYKEVTCYPKFNLDNTVTPSLGWGSEGEG